MPKQFFLFSLFLLFGMIAVTGCKKKPNQPQIKQAGTAFVLECLGASVHCKGAERKFQRTVCLLHEKMLSTQIKKAQAAAEKIYKSEGICTKETKFHCHILSNKPHSCKPEHK